MRLLPTKKEEYSFEEIIDEMIWEAWKTVTHYHLRLGVTVNGNPENFLEHAVRTLYECCKDDLQNKISSRERIKSLIRKYKDALLPDKMHLTDYVPYRLIKPFVDKEGKHLIDSDNYKRFIAYYSSFTKTNNEFFYDIIDGVNPLQRRIRLNREWAEFMNTHYALIMGWIQYKKADYLQDRNPGVPGVMKKISPEADEKRKSLEEARKLWIMTVELTGQPLREIYTGKDLEISAFDLDHFVPWSFVANDELWNLTPINKSLNSSKGNRLPEKRFIGEFINYHRYLYELMFDNDDESQARALLDQLDKCKTHNINANWAIQKLYRQGVSKTEFGNVLQENLELIYESARMQEYELWIQ